MEKLDYDQKQEILNQFGKRVIEYVRDYSLESGMNIARGDTVNPIKKEQYSAIARLSNKEKEEVCDLLSETISATIFSFLEMFEAYSDEMKIYVRFNNTDYDLNSVAEKMGAEIAFLDETGWIQKFSKIGRFVS